MSARFAMNCAYVNKITMLCHPYGKIERKKKRGNVCSGKINFSIYIIYTQDLKKKSLTGSVSPPSAVTPCLSLEML